DFGSGYLDVGQADRRNILDEKLRQTLLADPADRAEGDAVAMGEDEALVDPVLAREVRVGEFARRQHDLGILAVHQVAVVIHIEKLVVRPDLLQLAVRLEQRGMIPEPDVLDSGGIVGDIYRGELRIDIERYGFDLFQIVAEPGEPDIVLDVGCLQGQLVWGDLEFLQQPRIDTDADQIECHHDDRRQQRQAPGPFPYSDCKHGPRKRRQESQNPVGQQPGVDIHIAGTGKGAAAGKQQAEAVQIKARGDDAGEDPDQNRQMPPNLFINRRTTISQNDAATDKIGGS